VITHPSAIRARVAIDRVAPRANVERIAERVARMLEVIGKNKMPG